MKCSRGIKRNIIKQASIFLLLGAIVNVAVAWGFAWFTPASNAGGSWLPRKDDMEVDSEFIVVIRNMWEEHSPHHVEYHRQFYPMWTLSYDNGGLRYDQAVFSIGNHIDNLILIRTGFPMNCLSYHYYWKFENGWSDETAYRDAKYALLWKQPLPAKINKDSDRILALPLRPLWTGFVINTIFYGVVLWMLFVAPFVLRRWRRKRYELCIGCGYPIGTSAVCTECGTQLINPFESVE